MSERIKEGSIWRRKSDGQHTTVLGQPSTDGYAWVAHKGKRLTHTSRTRFLQKYEPVKEASDDRD
ncbi:hypothetical protein JD276_15700 [Leucobacter sp. CSA1]|uniref:Uncharacterized protein n=1 Tax=Leucobacter chromiisoli TaxID=2796471 RepID=A0A934UWP0_9MICO|nr:hypothetical protein [Leucobacter chromiisoli]MBK0420468.1 hypothetical protein [Leucobacter chromiisoli]